ncbi:MAG: LysE family transporter [Bacteroidales bacterium]|nr:LysE family transporter [Bacteroidales bacterium]
MIGVLFEGMIWGITLAITLGPAFFTIIQASIDKGFKSAFQIAIGVSLSDITVIVITYFGLSRVVENEMVKIYAGIAGGIVLILFGVYTFYKKPDIVKRHSTKAKRRIRKSNIFTNLAKGFFLNIANPFVYIFWIAVMTYVSQSADYGKMDQYAIYFFSGVIFTVFATDTLKSFVGYKIKKYLKPRIQLTINRIVGIILVVFGIILIVKLFF